MMGKIVVGRVVNVVIFWGMIVNMITAVVVRGFFVQLVAVRNAGALILLVGASHVALDRCGSFNAVFIAFVVLIALLHGAFVSVRFQWGASRLTTARITMSRFGWLCHGATAAVTAAIGFRATTRRAHTVGLAGVQWDLARCTTTMGLGPC